MNTRICISGLFFVLVSVVALAQDHREVSASSPEQTSSLTELERTQLLSLMKDLEIVRARAEALQWEMRVAQLGFAGQVESVRRAHKVPDDFTFDSKQMMFVPPEKGRTELNKKTDGKTNADRRPPK